MLLNVNNYSVYIGVPYSSDRFHEKLGFSWSNNIKRKGLISLITPSVTQHTTAKLSSKSTARFFFNFAQLQTIFHLSNACASLQNLSTDDSTARTLLSYTYLRKKKTKQAYTAFTFIVRSSIPAVTAWVKNKSISPWFAAVVASAIDFNSARSEKEIKEHLLCLRGVTNKTFHIHCFSRDSSDWKENWEQRAILSHYSLSPSRLLPPVWRNHTKALIKCS